MTGIGTLTDPYRIYNVDDLQAVQNDLDAYYELANNIDASATSGWNGGLGFEPISTFTGCFDGKDYKITGLFINRVATTGVGIFATTDTPAIVKNLVLENFNITGNYRVGTLAGTIYSSTITNVVAEDCIVVAANGWGGGLFGKIEDSSVNSCSFSGSVTCTSGGQTIGGFSGSCDGESNIDSCFSVATVIAYGTGAGGAGGFIGSSFGGNFSKCWSAGSVQGKRVAGFIDGLTLQEGQVLQQCYSTATVTRLTSNNHAGGLIGAALLYTGAEIRDCYARGDVDAGSATQTTIGGLIGYSYIAGTGGLIKNCYSTGKVTRGNPGGGLIGILYSGSVIDSFWDTETSEQSTSDGGTGKTTAEMKTKSTFTDAGWDFDTIWYITPKYNDGYPCFRGVPTYPYVDNSGTEHSEPSGGPIDGWGLPPGAPGTGGDSPIPGPGSGHFGNIITSQLIYQHCERMER